MVARRRAGGRKKNGQVGVETFDEMEEEAYLVSLLLDPERN